MGKFRTDEEILSGVTGMDKNIQVILKNMLGMLHKQKLV